MRTLLMLAITSVAHAGVVTLDSEPLAFHRSTALVRLTVEEDGERWRPLALEVIADGFEPGRAEYNVRHWGPYPEAVDYSIGITPPALGDFLYRPEREPAPRVFPIDDGYGMEFRWGGRWATDADPAFGVGFHENLPGLTRVDFKAVPEPGGVWLALVGLVAISYRLCVC